MVMPGEVTPIAGVLFIVTQILSWVGRAQSTKRLVENHLLARSFRNNAKKNTFS